MIKIPDYSRIPANAPGLAERFTDLCILTVGLMNTINLETASPQQRASVLLIEAFLAHIPPEWR
jgi:hypothetical protein